MRLLRSPPCAGARSSRLHADAGGGHREERANAEPSAPFLGAVAGAKSTRRPRPRGRALPSRRARLGFSPNGDSHDTELYVTRTSREAARRPSPRSAPRSISRRRRPCTALLADTHPSRALRRRGEGEASQKVAGLRARRSREGHRRLRQRHERDRGALYLDYFVVELQGAKVHLRRLRHGALPSDMGIRAYDVVGTDDAGAHRVLASGETIVLERMKLERTRSSRSAFATTLRWTLPKP